MLRKEIRLIASCPVQVTECPVWDQARSRLHFVDIYGSRILSMDWASGALSEMRTPELVGCIGLAENDDLVAGLKSGLALVER